jgi:hypothetical protein
MMQFYAYLLSDVELKFLIAYVTKRKMKLLM